MKFVNTSVLIEGDSGVYNVAGGWQSRANVKCLSCVVRLNFSFVLGWGPAHTQKNWSGHTKVCVYLRRPLKSM